MMFAVLVAIMLVASANAFAPFSSVAMRRMTLSMDSGKAGKAGVAPPGYKPMADGTYKKAGEHAENFLLDNENGSVAKVDTKQGGTFTWKNADGVELMTGKGVTHFYPSASAEFADEFFPEERAKKLSFDRMIFKSELGDQEYRIDVTLRADSLEYDVLFKNFAAEPVPIENALEISLTEAAIAAGYKITEVKGYVKESETKVVMKTTLPVGKFKETNAYMKISK